MWNIYEIDDGTLHFVIADSSDEALRLLHNYIGSSFIIPKIKQLDLNTPLKIVKNNKIIINSVEFFLNKAEKKGILDSVYKS